MGRLRSNHNHPATSDYRIGRTVLLQAELFHAYRGSGWFYYQSAGIGLLQ